MKPQGARRFILGLAIALAAGLGTAVMLAICLAVAGLYIAGHGIAVPEVTIDYGFLHLGGADLILLAAGFAVFALTLYLFFRPALPPGRR